MSRLDIDLGQEIARARQIPGSVPFTLPYHSLADLFTKRFRSASSDSTPFLIYYDDDLGVRRVYSYADFGRLTTKLMGWLQACFGIAPGDRVATLLVNQDVTVLVYFAVWALGAAVVPISVEETDEKKRYILEHSGAKLLIGREDAADAISQFQQQVPSLAAALAIGSDAEPKVLFSRSADLLLPTSPERPPSLQDEALIVYTSGTTGPPKGVVLTQENLLIDADGIADWHGFGPSDRLMCVLPIHHVNGIVVTLLTPFYSGGTAVLNRKFKTASFWKRIQTEQVTCVSVVPTLLEYLLEANEEIRSYRLDQLRGVICGAGPLLKETAARFEERFGVAIRHGYGLSETTCYSCFLPNDLSPEQRRHWLTAYEFPSIGVPIRHNEMAILDERGQAVPERVRGEICIRGRTVCAGYFKRPDANEAAFRWGWFRSGDEGFVVRDERGRPFFFISGRLKELIIRGGVNIAPLEIDDVLKSHPSVKFAMAVPFENRYYGEEIAAYVVPREGAEPTAAELVAFCRSRLPFAKCPKVILFGQDVPYTATGKPKRLELKTRLAPALAPYRDTQFKQSNSP